MDLGRSAELNKFGTKVNSYKNDKILHSIYTMITKIPHVLTERTPLGGKGGN
jgi:very-short-patch-repair endonuclease